MSPWIIAGDHCGCKNAEVRAWPVGVQGACVGTEDDGASWATRKSGSSLINLDSNYSSVSGYLFMVLVYF